MTTVHISVIDSFLQKSPLGTIYGHSLSDILGERMSKRRACTFRAHPQP